MFERELRLNGLMVGLVRKLLDGFDDSQLSIPLVPGGNCPAFTLGHLAIANDYALRYLGEPRLAPAAWHTRFKPGARPDDDTSPLPSKEELLAALDKGREHIQAAIAKVDPERMNAPHGSPFFKDTPVECTGDVVAHLLTSHLSFHIGQISAWRRLQGKPHII